MSVSVSIVIPVLNEADSIALLHREIIEVCEANAYHYEIIFVDDGSSDNTRDVILALRPVTYIRLRKTFGQTAALDAAIRAAKHEYVVTMDGDGQNDPNDIPKLFQCLEETAADVVIGWRRRREDRFEKRFVSRGAHLLRHWLLRDGIHDSGCALKLMRRDCFDEMILYGEMHRFIAELLQMKGYCVKEVEVNHRRREAGRTKYNMYRTVKGFVDMLYVSLLGRYSSRPLHLMGMIGLVLVFFGVLASTTSLITFVQGADLSDTVWPLLSLFFWVMGFQMFIFGVMFDLLVKNYHENTRDKQYSIKEFVEKG